MQCKDRFQVGKLISRWMEAGRVPGTVERICPAPLSDAMSETLHFGGHSKFTVRRQAAFSTTEEKKSPTRSKLPLHQFTIPTTHTHLLFCITSGAEDKDAILITLKQGDTENKCNSFLFLARPGKFCNRLWARKRGRNTMLTPRRAGSLSSFPPRNLPNFESPPTRGSRKILLSSTNPFLFFSCLPFDATSCEDLKGKRFLRQV